MEMTVRNSGHFIYQFQPFLPFGDAAFRLPDAMMKEKFLYDRLSCP